MKVLFALLCIVSATLAINCATAGDGFYCNADKSYTWCAGGGSYRMNCAIGTSCNCGTDVACASPCTSACEQGVLTDAQVFCQSRINSFGQQGYICDGVNGGGFYQCVRDAYCPQNASPRSSYIACPLGTSCLCDDNTKECSSALSMTPCRGNLTVLPVPECSGHKWDCYTVTSNDPVFCAEGGSCNADDFDDLNACFWNAETDDGICVEDFNCATAAPCNYESDCASGQACIINSCCGAAGYCASKCT